MNDKILMCQCANVQMHKWLLTLRLTMLNNESDVTGSGEIYGR